MSNHNPDTFPETLDELVKHMTGERFLRKLLVGPDNLVTYNVSALAPAARPTAKRALDAWADVLPFSFEPVESGEADILFSSVEGGTSYGGSSVDGRAQAQIQVAHSASNSMLTFIHEIGHALGLPHPDDYEAYYYDTDNPEPRFALDSRLTSSVSYYSPVINKHLTHADGSPYTVDVWPATPGIADIMALQAVYGAPGAVRPGDTVYGLESNFTGYLADTLATFRHRKHIEWGFVSQADLDGDGDADLVERGEDGRAIYFENTNTEDTPVWKVHDPGDPGNPFNGIHIKDPASHVFGDLDGDGDPDLVVTDPGINAVRYYENTGAAGSPAFNPEPAAPEHNPFRDIPVLEEDHIPMLADTDGDGDLDLAMYDGGNVLYENTGVAGSPVFSARAKSINTLVTLYDSGGTDTLDFSDDTRPQRLDLREEGISDVYGVRGNLVIARGTVIENAVAGRGDDTVIGNAADNVLEGGPGADSLSGGPGQDTAGYAGSPEGVTVRLHSLRATGGDAEGDSFPHTVAVTYRDAGGATQTDSLPDIEHLIGSAHNDTLAGDRRDNRIDGGAGDDTLYGGPGGGDDVLAGGPGNDRLYGGQGADTLAGGPGDDRLAGGPGADVFVFGPGGGADTVTDFSSGTDKIDLTGFDIERVEDVAMTTGGDGVTVDLTDIGGGTVLLADLTMLPEAGDFLV